MSMIQPSFVASSLTLLLAVVGCGGASPALGGTLPEVVEAPAPPSEHYDTKSSPAPVLGEERAADAVMRGVERAAEQAGTRIDGDGRLGLLAAWTAEHLDEGGAPPPHELVEFFTDYLGIVEPTPHLLIRGQPGSEGLEESIADSVSQFLRRQPYNHYGAAVIDRGGLMLAVVTLSSRHVRLERPIPRELSPGTPLELRGQLLDGYSDASIVVAQPDGEVVRRTGGEGAGFELRIPIEDEGEYGVEIIAQGPRGDSVVANFPVYVGVEAPRSVRLGREVVGEGGDAREVQQALLRLINETRRKRGLSPIRSHAGLDAVAEAHSRDMVHNDFVGHSSPTTGDAPERVTRAGYRSGLVLENIGRGYSPREIHRGLLQSPGHKANILNPDVTHVGIGVVAEDEDSRTAYMATEIFVRMNEKIDLSEAPERLLQMINEGRRARGAGRLEHDDNLQQAAQRAAEQFFEQSELSQQDVIDGASAELKRFSIAFHRVGGVMAVVSTLKEASRLEPTFDPEVRFVGIGVAQGSRHDTPPNAIGVVVMLGWPRQ